jgi:hypothetical protein
MRLLDLDRRTRFLLLAGLMVVCLASLTAVPVFATMWGVDLHNVHVFQQCVAGRSPYLVDAKACGDVLGRPFYYPPFLLACFRWSRPLSLGTTMRIWTVFLIVSFAVIFWAWARKIAREPAPGERYERHELVIFCVLLLLQYPFVFALERGNTDTVGVLFYTVAAVFFVRGRIVLAGVAAGLAAGFKLSPIVAVVVMTGALLWAWRSAGRWTWLRFAGGAFVSFLLTLVLFFRDAKIYLTEVLPKYSDILTTRKGEWGHAIPVFVGKDYPIFAEVLGLGLVLLWVWAGARAIARGASAMALAGSLAVSTYFQRTSLDYNLMTTFPLLLLLFLRAQRTNRWALLAFGLAAIAGDRRLFKMHDAHILTPQLHLSLQLAFLVVAALVAARADAEQKPTAAPAPEAAAPAAG